MKKIAEEHDVVLNRPKCMHEKFKFSNKYRYCTYAYVLILCTFIVGNLNAILSGLRGYFSNKVVNEFSILTRFELFFEFWDLKCFSFVYTNVSKIVFIGSKGFKIE